MNIVTIHCNPKPVEQSACRTVAQRLTDRLQDLYPGCTVTRHDLYLENIPEMDLACYERRAELMGADDSTDPEVREKIARIRELAEELLLCDRLILAAPMWNLGLPGRLKNYLDTIVLQGTTVEIRDSGIHGLLGDRERKALFIQSCGGRFGHAPLSLLNLGWHQVRMVLSALGFASVRLLPVDACGSTHEAWEKAVCRGLLAIDSCLEEF